MIKINLKIFQIGFNKCGTKSIFSFFKDNCQNELKCLHWETGSLALEMFQNMRLGKKLLGKYENYNVFTDMEALIELNKNRLVFYAHMECYKILDAQYPRSKFILNTRDVNKWIESRRRHYGPHLMQFFRDFYETDDIEQLWLDQWNRHHKEVKEHFKNKNNLLVFNIDKDKGSKIAEFIPSLKFKQINFPFIK